jgi:hypothetical protein
VFGILQSFGFRVPNNIDNIALLECPVVDITIKRANSMMPTVTIIGDNICTMTGRGCIEVECCIFCNFLMAYTNGNP